MDKALSAHQRRNLVMKSRAGRLRFVVMTLAIGFFLTGCATPPSGGSGAGASQTDLLKQAGFQVYTANTPKKIAYINTLPAKVVVSNQYQGQTHYLVRTDPNSRQCYVGNREAYQRYQQLAEQASIAQEQRQVAAQRWDPEATEMWAASQGAGP
jgi:hypothetical protein